MSDHDKKLEEISREVAEQVIGDTDASGEHSAGDVGLIRTLFAAEDCKGDSDRSDRKQFEQLNVRSTI